jgi:hypothetical protein
MQPISSALAVPEADIGNQPHSKNCIRIKDLGYIAGKRLSLYGEHFEIVSDPFTEDDCVAVRATSGNDPTIRTIRLPVSLLVGLKDLSPEHLS